MQRYFVSEPINGTTCIITGDDVHHIKNVMRFKVGQNFYVSDNEKTVFVEIKSLNESEVICEILNEEKENKSLPINVTIAQGLPKGDKFEYVIQKITELGVDTIIPVLSKRSVIKLDEQKKQKKLTRWQKIVKEASEQSHRQSIPNVNPVVSVKTLIEQSKDYDYKCIAYEASTEAEKYNLKKTLNTIKNGEKMIVFIGPEGGISDDELELFKDNGFQVISLGPRILRTETAPIFVMSAVAYQLEG